MSEPENLTPSDLDRRWINAGWLAIVFLFFASFAFGLLKVFPGYVHWDTGEAFLWSTLGFKFEYVKHPPLLAWVIGVFDIFLPMNWVTLTGIAALNLTIGALAIWRASLLVLDPARGFAALFLYCLSPYHVWHAMKFDHNAILISTWSFLVWAFLCTLRRPNVLSGLWLGLAAALTVYAKFQSIIILSVLGMICLFTSSGRALLKRSSPYLSLVVFLAFIAPLYFHSESVIGYATGYSDPVTFPIQYFEVSLARQSAILLMAGLFLFLYGRDDSFPLETKKILALLSLLPFALTFLMTILVDLRGSQAWMAPAFVTLPIFLTSFVSPRGLQRQNHLKPILYSIFCGLIFGGFLSSYYAFRFQLKNEIEPRIEVINEAADLWTKVSGNPVALIAGDMPLSVAATLELKHHPKSWAYFDPGFWWVSPKDIEEKGMLAFCRSHDASCLNHAQKFLTQQGGFQCVLEAQRERFGLASPLLQVSVFFIPPLGKSFQQICKK